MRTHGEKILGVVRCGQVVPNPPHALPEPGGWRMMDKVLVILLFGPPGCGKGTQGRLIIDWLHSGIPSISTGEMLRREVSAGTSLGGETKSVIAAGGLVSDEIINGIVARRIQEADCRGGFLLDGYPRTLQQAEFLDDQLARLGLQEPVVVHLDVPEDVLVNRIICRRQCRDCAGMYNILSRRPKSPGRCDACGGSLIVRQDDREEVVRARLRGYEAQTKPVIAHYEDRHYCHIGGDRSPRYIFEAITQALEPFVTVGAGVR